MPTMDEKLDLIMWELFRQQKMLHEIGDTLVTVSAEQADFNADIATLTTFVTGLSAQLTAIVTALADQGVTDVTPLDDLVTEVNALAPTLANLPGGTPATPAA